ncbi:DivIVA domain-containing protein [Leucobacter coleopterorum]|uniref:DivIVA domain-containing protein n=1 Tax=Leucobacter coleopterorum TaxID=2714933 RepID=UPI00197DB749
MSARFAITKFRTGYDLNEVDDFLDTVVRQLREEPHVDAIVNTISAATFRQTKWRDGYTIEQVDGFLAELAGTLRARQDPDPGYSI